MTDKLTLFGSDDDSREDREDTERSVRFTLKQDTNLFEDPTLKPPPSPDNSDDDRDEPVTGVFGMGEYESAEWEMSQQPESALASLDATIERLGGSPRDGQRKMVRHIAESLNQGRHALIEAPTGVGKSFGYLIPTIQRMSDGGTIVVATATKALQQQLVEKDLPLIAETFPGLTWAVVKGRSNYVCKDRLDQLSSGSEETLFEERIDASALGQLVEWAKETDTGDQVEAPDGTTQAEWKAVSVGPNECHGKKCKFYEECFAERAKEQASQAHVIVTNTHMLLLNAAMEYGSILPDHDLVVLDEAHKLPGVANGVFGVTLRAGRIGWLASACSTMCNDAEVTKEMEKAGKKLTKVLEELSEKEERVFPTGKLLGVLQSTLAATVSLRMKVVNHTAASEQESSRREQMMKALENLQNEIDDLIEADEFQVLWVESGDGKRSHALRMAPVNVSQIVEKELFSSPVRYVMASATLTVGGKFDHFRKSSGLENSRVQELVVSSPFDFKKQAVLFVPRDSPEPKVQAWDDIAKNLTLDLLNASEGRAMLLFTSWRRLNSTVEWLEDVANFVIYKQGTAPPNRLVEKYKSDYHSVLAGTTSFWEGIDVQGDTSSLVIIDKIPFPRPTDPLLSAQKEIIEKGGGNGFMQVDIPHAAMLLAQGSGRLIRHVEDRGAVAILDSRLANKRYKDILLNSMPPFRRTIDIEDIRKVLQ